MNKKPCIFNEFVLENFPYIEQDFDSLTNYQLFSKIVGYVQNIKKIVDEHSEFITEFESEYNELLTEFNQLKVDFETFKISIQAEIDSRFASMRTELVALINNEINSLEVRINNKLNQINSRIDDIEAGAVNVYDPTTGLYSPIQVVIDNLYDLQRNNALTATEFDGLELTATGFDSYEITAINFDVMGKEILSQ